MIAVVYFQKKFSAEVPESALESILKHQDFKKKISNKPPPMKYNNVSTKNCAVVL